ncbi:MAG: acyl-CoA dehydrogenase family protein [Paracoccaceae bacterium]
MQIDIESETGATGGARSLMEKAARLAAEFAARAEEHDREGRFVEANYEKLKQAGLFRAAVPQELGGGGADLAEVCDIIRLLARGCGSTGLAFAMHSHQVVIPAWRWRHQPQAKAAVEPLLKRVASSDTILLTSGGTDWVGGSGRAERVKGGWLVHAKKTFVSAAPAGTLLITGVVCDGEVLHFALPMDAPEVRIIQSWNTLGMRATASQDVEIDGFFLAEDKVVLRRKAGVWHPLFQIIGTLAFPLIYAAYLGVAESARDIALDFARRRAGPARQPRLAGEMELALRGARFAHRAMIAEAERNAPSADSVAEVMLGRRLVADHAIRTVELALELSGGAGFYRQSGIERCFRDVQGARYHPMRRESAELYAGALALGDPVADIY